MVLVLARRWWVIALRGILGVLFGVAAISWPALTVQALVLLFGAYVLADGLVGVLLFATTGGPTRRPRWLLLLEGLAGVALGAVAFLWPAMTTTLLLYFIAAWAVLTGALEIGASALLRGHRGATLLALSGLASIALGALVFARPWVGAIAIASLVGAYALVFGGLLLALGLWLRAHRGRPWPGERDPGSPILVR